MERNVRFNSDGFQIAGVLFEPEAAQNHSCPAVVLCQGGFSSLSEALAPGKRTLAAPLPGHVEQEVNVRLLADRGALCVLEGIWASPWTRWTGFLRRWTDSPLTVLRRRHGD